MAVPGELNLFRSDARLAATKPNQTVVARMVERLDGMQHSRGPMALDRKPAIGATGSGG